MNAERGKEAPKLFLIRSAAKQGPAIVAMGVVRGVLLDGSLLLDGDDIGDPSLAPATATLLRRLQYSNLRVGICHEADVSAPKAAFFTRTGMLYSIDCISLHPSDMGNSFNKLLQAWIGVGETSLFVTSRKDDKLFLEFQNCGWKVVYISADNGADRSNKLIFIDELEKLPLTVCNYSKKAMSDTSVLIIGYVMKPSREEDFAKRSAFPLYPTQNGLMFVPLSLESPLASQIQEVDVILHKATDEIINIDLRPPLGLPKGISFTSGMQELERYIQGHPDHCVIDPLNNIYPLLDRHKIQKILLGLQNANINGSHKLRAPCFLKLDDFHEANLREQLLQANLSFPVIVKPQVACGVADAHNMALVFKLKDFRDLCVPLPAIVQEYVDHGSLLFKFYVLGDKVFHAVKKSMPNSDILIALSEKTGFTPITFNSLKSLPVAPEEQLSKDHLKDNEHLLDVELINAAAKWLRNQLDLTIFGFDVVVEQVSGDHVIVDLNYLPSFKEVADCDAIPAFWDAIKNSYSSRKGK